MATYTENHKFILPDETDTYDVADMNENFAATDAALAAVDAKAETLGGNITETLGEMQDDLDTMEGNLSGTLETVKGDIDSMESNLGGTLTSMQTTINSLSSKVAALQTTVNTMSGKVNAMPASPIKSIQHVFCSPDLVYTGSVPIQTVDPAKCIVLFERLHDQGVDSGTSYLKYTLNATSLDFEVTLLYTSGSWRFGFWIIEFY